MANPYAGLKYSPDESSSGSPFAGLKYVEDEPEQYSPIETVGRNAVNLFGAGPALSGVVQHLMSGRDYTEGRDETRRHLEEANEQNPTSALVGKGLALVGETAVGGGVGKAISLGSRAIGVTEALSPLMQKLGTTGAAAAKGALGGAGYGAASSAGEALSEGKDVLPATLEGAGSGAILGGAIGGVVGKIGETYRNARGLQNESIVRGASERALPRKQSALANLFGDAPKSELTDVESSIESLRRKSTLDPSQVIQENRDILKGFRSGKYEDVARASEAVADRVSELESGKAANYKRVDKALKGGFEARTPIDALENKAATETEAPWKKVLQNKADALKTQWSSISTDEAKRYLASMRVSGDQGLRDALEGVAAKLPEGKQWTKADFLDELVGKGRGSARANWADIDPDLRKAVESLPFKFDGTLKVPTQDLRRVLTMAQDEAETALGTLNATKNARLAALSQEVLGTTMDRTLDHAGHTLTPGIDEAIQAIRDTNMQQSVLLKLNEAASRKIEKLQLGKPTLGGIASHGAANLLGGYEALGAVKHVLTGDLGGAAKDAGAAILAKAAPSIIAGSKRGAVDALALLQREVAKGNPRAIKLLRAAQAARKVGTAGAGSLGAVTAGTLSNE